MAYQNLTSADQKIVDLLVAGYHNPTLATEEVYLVCKEQHPVAFAVFEAEIDSEEETMAESFRRDRLSEE